MSHQRMPRIEPKRFGHGEDGGETIELGRGGRGGILLLHEPDVPRWETADRLNLLAERGYPGVGMPVRDGAGVRAVQLGLARLAEAGWERPHIGVVGVGPGTAAAFATGARGVGPVVALAPPAEGLLSALSALRVPTLVVLGARAPDLPGPTLERVRAAARAAPELVEVVVHPEVRAGFARSTADTEGHAAWFDSWQRTLEWFDQRVAPRPTPLALAWERRRSPVEEELEELSTCRGT